MLLLSEVRSCVNEEVDVLGSPSLTVRTVSVDVRHQERKKDRQDTVSDLRICMK